MGTIYSTSLLASFATIKSLYDAKKYRSVYQILGEFIRHIISEESLYLFSAAEMKNKLSVHFGFIIPEAVIKTTAKNLAGVSLADGFFSVDQDELGTDSLFTDKKKEADNSNTSIINLLTEFVEERTGAPASMDVLTQALIGFLIDDQHYQTNKYSDLVGEFVLKNEKNKDVVDALNRIREGSVLYVGLNHNICETGSITKPLTLFLGTEILFSLAGFNGEIYKRLAEDFYNQVRLANSKGTKKVHLFYFADVKKEIDDYFLAAGEIVDGRKAKLISKPAMKEITNGCTTSGDVLVKQADFYSKLKTQYGICIDPTKSYYNEALFETNLESTEYDDEEDKAKRKELGIKYVSHINKLRNGKAFTNEVEAEYLLITNSKITLSISKEQTERIKSEEKLDYIASFAIPLERITSLLWYKLGNGFGNSLYPVNVDAVLRARVVLSSIIAKNAEKAYFDTKKQYESGSITEDQLAARIITIRHKPMLPEDLIGDDIEIAMDFSPEYLSQYEEQVKSDRKALEEKNRVIEDIKNRASVELSEKNSTIEAQIATIADKDKELALRDETITNQERALKTRDNENKQLQTELDEYKKKEAAENAKKERKRKTARKFLSIGLKLLLVVGVTILSVYICSFINESLKGTIGIVVGIVGILLTLLTSLHKK